MMNVATYEHQYYIMNNVLIMIKVKKIEKVKNNFF